MNVELKPIAESKVRQLGGDVCGVLVRTEGGVMAVSEHGRCTRLDAGVMGPVETEARESLFSERDLFLMKEAMNAGQYYENLEDWLGEVISDGGHTVEQHLAHDADQKQAARAQGDDWLIQLRGDYLITRGIWERADHRGYTNDISEAGRYSEAEARKAEQDSPEKYKAVRLPTTRAQGGQGAEVVALTGRIHELKTDPTVFSESMSGRKPWEIRKNDRDYRAGDTVVLRETTKTGAEIAAGAQLQFTGRTATGVISFVLDGPAYGLSDGWCIFSLYTQPQPNQQGSVPEGWKLVPIASTSEMEIAVDDLGIVYVSRDVAEVIWDVMIDAAPQPPKQEGE